VVLLRLSRREPKEVVDEYDDMYGNEADRDEEHETRNKTRSVIINVSLLIAGFVIIVFGANLLVNAAVEIARSLGLTETIIGLTIIAFGTAAPELSTTIIGTLRNDRDVAVGNLIGSSIYNILVILGIVAIVAPGGLPVAREVLIVDIGLMVLVALVCIPIFVSGKRITRLEGILFVAAYLAYLTSIILFRA
jgi:cation:H+ antiporter